MCNEIRPRSLLFCLGGVTLGLTILAVYVTFN